VLNRAAKILDRFNNFRTSYFRPGSVLDKYKVIDDDKKVKNKKEIYIDKQPSNKVKEDNWLEEASEDLRKEREKELKHVMKSEIFSGNTLIVNKTVDWSKEYNANFVLEMLSRYICKNVEYRFPNIVYLILIDSSSIYYFLMRSRYIFSSTK